MRTGTVKFFNESKGYGFITDEETGKDILFMLQESTRKNYAKETELAMKKKKEEKEKLCESSSYLSKKFIFCLRMSKTFRFIRNAFFCINLKITLKNKDS
jgi:CspA family cold shock protein